MKMKIYRNQKKARIRTLVNLVGSQSLAHYANETFQLLFFFDVFIPFRMNIFVQKMNFIM